MKCPICKGKINGWSGLGNLPMIAQCLENPRHFYFLSDIAQAKSLSEIVSEREKRIAEEILDAIDFLKRSGFQTKSFQAESEFRLIDEKDGLDIVLTKMSRGPFHPNIVSNERQMELLKKYMVTSLVISKEAEISGGY